MEELVIVREWDAEQFHAKVHEWEEKGYTARHESYHITAEMDPESGKIVHLHTIELVKLDDSK
jgi:hypothetical protein